MEKYCCPICGNSEQKYIGYLKGKPYCRKCISFHGEEAPEYKHEQGMVVLDIKYQLSAEQKKISDALVENYKNGIDTLVNAVCGAGKTELVFSVISYALSLGKNVAFAIPRRDVVVELASRLKSAFPSNNIVSVYGGSTAKLNGDIVVLTTHQLYRYPHHFDLIVMDEIDAFPYKGSDVLECMFQRALRGRYVLMSATPSKDVIDAFRKDGKTILSLNTRFHGHPLPVPQVVIRFGLTKTLFLLKTVKRFIKMRKPILIFVPTIEICESVYSRLSLVFHNGCFVHSKCEERSRIISDFKKGRHSYLVTTAVLERGVTIRDLNVIIFDSDHKLYDEHSLVQISGRVGRKIDAPKGEVIFIASKETNAMSNAIRTISNKNLFL